MCMNGVHRSITKACLGPRAQSPGACVRLADRAQSVAGVGTANATSPPRPLLRSGLCHQGHQPACLLQASSPLSQPSLKTPDLTLFPAQNPFLGPRGQRTDREVLRGAPHSASWATLAFSLRPRSLSTPAHLPALGDATLPLPLPLHASSLGKRASCRPHHGQRKEPCAR